MESPNKSIYTVFLIISLTNPESVCQMVVLSLVVVHGCRKHLMEIPLVSHKDTQFNPIYFLDVGFSHRSILPFWKGAHFEQEHPVQLHEVNGPPGLTQF